MSLISRLAQTMHVKVKVDTMDACECYELLNACVLVDNMQSEGRHPGLLSGWTEHGLVAGGWRHYWSMNYVAATWINAYTCTC